MYHPQTVPHKPEALAPGAVDLKKLDPMFRDIATYVVNSGQGSTSII